MVKTLDLAMKTVLAGVGLLFLLAVLFGGDIDEDIGV
ncbi:hypothetical protein SAMN05421858_3639 [Haladaptatus litoreus]|uniref:Uncharacterized protein n=1 Tax=Haladaptatus litoreus TaxID=553468 RepID=A0A1N7DHZ4_9EURY|nr:hypothetical protein SAMN05421858_3639 [Haladaptatus litoreus]